ncbi:hypothetical protein PHLCEN_2v1569 [Hermanssonia centrifuga]|uniref:Uncharacterized protein n=1 Tax=Hermanssonia centrifuga TaxID=98765 RepID=A0A2R6RZF7_9APHY|nr:hypothetical protein PHLCEN_2v1569 [Hermanssonia centrifuga]
MDDDFALGSSVWGATEQLAISVPSPLLSQPSPAPSSSQDGFDDFDDFGTPAETIAASGDEADDDFGDFGDFGEGTQVDFVSESFEEEVSTPRPTGVAPLDWSPLHLNPIPSRPDLQRQLEHIAGPLWYSGAPSDFIGDPIRQAEGLNQTLVTPESRQLYDLLLPATQPTFKPVNWTRSRIRRQHLITLGIPVNLDEVLPRAGAKLPTLEIHTRPTSAPPAPYTAPARPMVSSSRGATPRSGTPQPGVRSTALATAQLRLGPKPAINDGKITSLLELDTGELVVNRIIRFEANIFLGNLLLLPAKTLDRHLNDLREQTAQTSALLTYLLQTRDALQQDSETYNKLIGELVGEAQKIKTGKRTGSVRRGSAGVS